MLLYYTKLAWRNLSSKKFFSLLNIFGLAIGFAACMAVFLFVKDEKSYDRQNKNADRIYRIISNRVNDDGTQTWLPVTPPALSIEILHQLPEAEQAVRLFPPSSAWGSRFYVRTGDKKFYEENIYRADNSIFDVFTIPFVMGSPATALNEANSIVLTTTMAKKYFGNENPIGKIINVDDWEPYTVTAVISDFPETVHFKIDMIISLQSLDRGDRLSSLWGWSSFYTYVRLKSGTSQVLFDKKIAALFRANNPDNKNEVRSQLLTSIHLHSNLTGELKPNSDPLYSYIFAAVSLLILLSAGINYINLSTAMAAVRAKEIAMRKIAGAGIGNLLWQFLTEALLSALVAALLALIMVWLFLPVLNSVTGKQIYISQHLYIISYTILFSLLTGLLAGVYPALQLCFYKPVDSLKAVNPGGRSNSLLRKLLVILQFSISAVMITGMVIVNQQLNYMQREKQGLDKSHVMIVNDIGYLDRSEAGLLKKQWMKISGVEKVAAADGVPGGYNWTRDVRSKDVQNKQIINFLSIDDDFIAAFGMQIIEGRNFSSRYAADTADKVILNETAVKKLNIAAPVPGHQIVWSQNAQTGEIKYATICGVVKDFHFSSMKDTIRPFALVRRNDRQWVYAIRLSTGNIHNTVAAIKKTWNENIHNRPFQYTFLDETYAKLYASETNFKTIYTCISFVSVLIACMGLFGVSLFVTRQRIKEISIRKILGASPANIALLLSNDFLRLIMIASFIALPVAWWWASAWLQRYAYHTSIGWKAFALADLVVVFAALLTVGFHAARAAITNPARNLRIE